MNAYVTNELESNISINNNYILVLKFIDLIKKYNSNNNISITENELLEYSDTKLKQIVNTSLQKNKMKEYALLKLKIDINEADELINKYRNTFVQGDNLSINEQGKTNGGGKYPADAKHIKLIQMKEEQQQRIEKYEIYKKEVEQRSIWLKDLIDNIIPNQQDQYKTIMKLYYLDDVCTSRIALELGFTDEYVDRGRWQGVATLTQAVRIALSKAMCQE